MSLVELDKPSHDTAKRLSGLKPWKPGQSGNPAGRPMQARQRLTKAFVDELSASFAKKGRKAIDKLADTDPASYVRVICSLVPKELLVSQGPLAELSQEELAALAYAARKAVAMADDNT